MQLIFAHHLRKLSGAPNLAMQDMKNVWQKSIEYFSQPEYVKSRYDTVGEIGFISGISIPGLEFKWTTFTKSQKRVHAWHLYDAMLAIKKATKSEMAVTVEVSRMLQMGCRLRLVGKVDVRLESLAESGAEQKQQEQEWKEYIRNSVSELDVVASKKVQHSSAPQDTWKQITTVTSLSTHPDYESRLISATSLKDPIVKEMTEATLGGGLYHRAASRAAHRVTRATLGQLSGNSTIELPLEMSERFPRDVLDIRRSP